MVRVHVLVEGQTEETFVNRVLQPHLNGFGVYLYPRLAGGSGGIGRYQRDKRDLLLILKQDTSVFCTTMFDYYGMPHSWPGRETAGGRAEVIEQAILNDICGEMGRGFNQARFIPYVQMHEFEALLFSEWRPISNCRMSRRFSKSEIEFSHPKRSTTIRRRLPPRGLQLSVRATPK